MGCIGGGDPGDASTTTSTPTAAPSSTETLMPTPEACPDPPNPETSARDLIPEPPEDWELQGTFTDERKVPPTEEYVIGSFVAPSEGGYNVIVSRWSTTDVEDVWIELMNDELAAEIDLWFGFGQFVFASYTPDDEDQLETILAASPGVTAECVRNLGRDGSKDRQQEITDVIGFEYSFTASEYGSGFDASITVESQSGQELSTRVKMDFFADKTLVDGLGINMSSLPPGISQTKGRSLHDISSPDDIHKYTVELEDLGRDFAPTTFDGNSSDFRDNIENDTSTTDNLSSHD